MFTIRAIVKQRHVGGDASGLVLEKDGAGVGQCLLFFTVGIWGMYGWERREGREGKRA